MTESNDDIFNHIKSVMRHHEEAYDEGAWERFKVVSAPAPVKKGVIPIWKRVMAAAAVVTTIFLLARVFDASTPVSDPSSPMVGEASTPVDSPVNNIAQASPEIQSESPAVRAEGLNELTDGHNNNLTAIHQNNVASALTNYKPGIRSAKVNFKPGIIQGLGAPTHITAPPSSLISPRQNINTAAVSDTKKSEIDFWKTRVETDVPKVANTPKVYQEEEKYIVAARPQATNKSDKEKNRKWQPSLYVSPLFGDLGIDMGYGVSVGYAINDKIKISSGVAYNKLSASRNYSAGPLGNMIASAPTVVNGAQGVAEAAKPGSALDSKAALTSAYNVVAGQQTNSLQQVDGFLTGIDIPVEINYNISKKLYASAGVSGLVVINDNKKYTYVDNRNVKVSVETNRGALKEDKSVLFTEQNTTTQSMQTPTENTPFLGFYNISMGYRQKISGRTGVALEPFLKVPMRNVTQENLKYIGTGIRLKVDL
ncbi:hypothetical protein U0035_20775 [Niabella yanshanensis]|uniref:Outer membrane protein beta-barrel domain-containing protein n=1 Tax=Niabella yanshanensis TaxID=577386 RepID=A0ABZ0W4B3_9BACT|nr:hypothetical protein [Niabella yanshanensis]WQD38105.1 hypothetical protein U0035_20775 [Niabella yanshanensis]